MNVNADDIDNRLLAGDVDVDAAGTGVQAAARAKILDRPTLKANADNPLTGALVHRHRHPGGAAEQPRTAAWRSSTRLNKSTSRRAYGGPAAAADRDHRAAADRHRLQEFDLYEATTKPTGDLAKAKQQLEPAASRTGSPPRSPTAATGPRRPRPPRRCRPRWPGSGSRRRCTATRPPTYDANFAGVPKYVHAHDIGIMVYGWAPTGRTATACSTHRRRSRDQPGRATPTCRAERPGGQQPAHQVRQHRQRSAERPHRQIDMQVMKDAAILPGVTPRICSTGPRT